MGLSRSYLIIGEKKISFDEFLKSDQVNDTSEFTALRTFLIEWKNDKPNIKLQTSGTTGPPKTISAPKTQLIKSANRTNEFFNLSKSSILFQCLPLSFIAGKLMVIRTLISGGTLVSIFPSINPLKNIKKIKLSFAAFTPHQIVSILKDDESAKTLSKIDNVIIGGSKLNLSLENKLIDLKVNAYETYGSTETYTHVALRKIGEQFFQSMNTIFLSQHKNGCLIIKGDSFLSKAILTNDYVALKSTTSFKWLGRSDNIINSGGIKCSPELIETAIEESMSNDFCVSSVPDETLGEKIVVVISNKEVPPTKNQFTNVPKGLVPKGFIRINELPKTESNKVKRNELKTLIKDLIATELK